jgi:hypothetical protein
VDREIHSSPRRELGRLLARYFVGECNSVAHIRTQVGMSLEPGEHRYDLGGPREEGGEYLRGDLFERKFMSLPVQRVDDFLEAHEITDERQVLAIAGLVRVCECAGNDGTEFADVAHVNGAHGGIDRNRPTQSSVFLLLRSRTSHQVLVEKGCYDERVTRKPGFLHDPIDLGLAGEVRNMELASADRFHIGQRRPDKVFDRSCFGRLYRCGCLLKLICTLFQKIRDQENAMGSCECGLEGLGTIEIRFDNFVG